MTMKRTELDKRRALEIVNAQRRAGNRYGSAQAMPADRKARREADRAAGRVPFAVKLPAALVAEVQARASRTGATVDEVAAALLRRALDAAD